MKEKIGANEMQIGANAKRRFYFKPKGHENVKGVIVVKHDHSLSKVLINY